MNSPVSKKKPFRLGLDADGVVLDGIKQKQRVLKECFGVEVPADGLKKELIERYGISRLEYEEMKMRAYRNRDEALKFEFVEGADYYIPLMWEHGWNLPVITCRPAYATAYINELFALKGLTNLQAFSNEYEEDKSAVIEQVGGVDAYVDDDLDKLLKLRKVVKHLLLFTQDYNVKDDCQGIAIRVRDWTELYVHCCALAGVAQPSLL